MAPTKLEMSAAMDYLLGIDVGTSGGKAAVVDVEGHVHGVGRHEYGIDIPQPGWAEQDPAVWVQAARIATGQALEQAGVSPAAILGIGLSGQMHTTVCLDSAGCLIRPAIVWSDQRSAPQVAEVYQRLGRAWLARTAQNPLATGFTLASLLWLQENEADLYAHIAHIMLPKDYVRYYLTGEIGTEPSDAAGTLLMDVAAGEWSAEIVDTCGIDPGILPPIAPSASIAGHLCADAASAFGLPAGIPVVYGGADQAAQAVGNGIVRPGILSSTIGTGGQLMAPSTAPAYDSQLRLHTFCHAVPGQWYILGATLSAGLSLSWLRRVLKSESYSTLADAAMDAPAGAEGLFFLPYLSGERTPHMDPAARGAFIGLTLGHDRQHLARAVMEGVVFSLRQGLDLIEGLGVTIERVIASGGATRHPLWLQLQADIFDKQIYQTRTEEAAASGAALLAGVGAGVYSNIEDACARAVHMSELVVRPDPASAARYATLREVYNRLYPAVKSGYDPR